MKSTRLIQMARGHNRHPRNLQIICKDRNNFVFDAFPPALPAVSISACFDVCKNPVSCSGKWPSTFPPSLGAHQLNLPLAGRTYLHQREHCGRENQRLSHITVGQGWQDAVAQQPCPSFLCPGQASALSRLQAAAPRWSDNMRCKSICHPCHKRKQQQVDFQTCCAFFLFH